jgi:MinD superfamily P-loop ATPase
VKEIVVISGKGGTGKTSITASFAALAKNAVFADCDVDAADLHLILSPDIQSQHDFISGNEAVIRSDDCSGCGKCQEHCRFEAVEQNGDGKFQIDSASCEGCGVCVRICPTGAIDFLDRHCGQWFLSTTRFGPMVHAKLGIAAENSGKLVALVRSEAKRLAEEHKADLILVDGPPGTGCPVIASITGADAVVVVTEPTMSGIHDLKRIVQLTRHFDIPAYVCLNKWDINVENSEQIERFASDEKCQFIGKIPYTKEMTKAQIAAQTVIEFGSDELRGELEEVWKQLCQRMQLTIVE